METDKRIIDYLTANMKKWKRDNYFSIENNLEKSNTVIKVTDKAIDKMMASLN